MQNELFASAATWAAHRVPCRFREYLLKGHEQLKLIRGNAQMFFCKGDQACFYFQMIIASLINTIELLLYKYPTQFQQLLSINYYNTIIAKAEHSIINSMKFTLII